MLYAIRVLQVNQSVDELDMKCCVSLSSLVKLISRLSGSQVLVLSPTCDLINIPTYTAPPGQKQLVSKTKYMIKHIPSHLSNPASIC